jgi:hypothetical protein
VHLHAFPEGWLETSAYREGGAVSFGRQRAALRQEAMRRLASATTLLSASGLAQYPALRAP